MWIAAGILSGLLLAAGVLLVWQICARNMQRWLGPYLRQRLARLWVAGGGKSHRLLPAARHSPPTTHLLLCLADHFEPRAQGVSREQGLKRVQYWVSNYPRLFGRFRDSDGRPPCHTFFFPVEEYEPEYLDALAELCRQGFGEVEIHLHHDGDTADGFRQKLLAFRDVLVERHGLLSRNKQTGQPAYAFIHGNWALCNSRSDGTCCGVNNELDILRETGCFVDMTFPSAPNANQPAKINSIYYAIDKPGRPGSHETGWNVGTCPPPPTGLMLVTGPLMLDWGRRKWGLLPRLENGCLQKSQPPSAHRLDTWLRAGIRIPTRPDWFFVKLHAHGGPEECHDTLLGQPMVALHEELARRAKDDPHFYFHYVTAREMYNLAKAAEAGFPGGVAQARDYLVVSNIALKEPCTK